MNNFDNQSVFRGWRWCYYDYVILEHPGRARATCMHVLHDPYDQTGGTQRLRWSVAKLVAILFTKSDFLYFNSLSIVKRIS